jgi:hypothetical protein
VRTWLYWLCSPSYTEACRLHNRVTLDTKLQPFAAKQQAGWPLSRPDRQQEAALSEQKRALLAKIAELETGRAGPAYTYSARAEAGAGAGAGPPPSSAAAAAKEEERAASVANLPPGVLPHAGHPKAKLELIVNPKLELAAQASLSPARAQMEGSTSAPGTSRARAAATRLSGGAAAGPLQGKARKLDTVDAQSASGETCTGGSNRAAEHSVPAAAAATVSSTLVAETASHALEAEKAAHEIKQPREGTERPAAVAKASAEQHAGAVVCLKSEHQSHLEVITRQTEVAHQVSSLQDSHQRTLKEVASQHHQASLPAAQGQQHDDHVQHTNAVGALRLEAARLKQEHAELLGRAESAHTAAEMTLRREHSAAMASLSMELTAQLMAESTAHVESKQHLEAAMSAAAAEHAAQMEAIVNHKEGCLAELEATVERLGSEHAVLLAETNAQHEAAMARQRVELAAVRSKAK